MWSVLRGFTGAERVECERILLSITLGHPFIFFFLFVLISLRLIFNSTYLPHFHGYVLFTELFFFSYFCKTFPVYWEDFLPICRQAETETPLLLFFLQVHRKIREDSDMAQDSLQCLAQLASMHGPIFPDESAQVSYLAHLVEGLLSMINGSVLPNKWVFFFWDDQEPCRRRQLVKMPLTWHLKNTVLITVECMFWLNV